MPVKHCLKTELTACYLDDCLYLPFAVILFVLAKHGVRRLGKQNYRPNTFRLVLILFLMLLTRFILKGHRMRHKCPHREMSL